MTHVFISYARADGREFAEALQQALLSDDIPVWRDQRDLNPHQDFSAEIERAIEQASHVVVCLTPSIANRQESFVRREIVYSLGCRIPMTPVLLPGFPVERVPVLINHLTWLSFRRPDDHSQLDFRRGYQQLHSRLTAVPSVRVERVESDLEERLRDLYRRIVAYLDQTVFSLVAVRAQSSPAAVQGAAVVRRALPMTFFAAALPVHKEPPQPPSRIFDTIDEAFTQARGQLLLLGEPGAGKTTALMAFAREALARRLDDPREPLPLVGRVADWEMAGMPALPNWLAESVGYPTDVVLQAFEQGRALLLLDGLDELSGAIDAHSKSPRERFIGALEDCLDGNQVVISCRVRDYHDIGRKLSLRGAVTLSPLDDDRLRGYLLDQPRLHAAVMRDSKLRELVRTPLLLALLTFAFESLDSASLPDPDVLQQVDLGSAELRDHIFAQYVRRSFEHESLRVNAALEFSLDRTYELLGKAALLKNIGFVPLEDILATLLGPAADRLIEQSIRLHLLIRDERQTLRFVHLLVRDHFGFPVARAALSGFSSSDEAVALLGSMDDPRVGDLFLQNEVDSYGRLSLRVMETASINDARLVPPLIRWISDATEADRYGDRTMSDLARAILQDMSGDFRHQAIVEVVKVAQSASRRAKADCLRALGVLCGASAASQMIGSLGDPDPEVVEVAVLVLHHFGNADAVQPLQALALDTRRLVRPFWHYGTGPEDYVQHGSGSIGELVDAAIQAIRGRAA
jgi:hypothetical protein